MTISPSFFHISLTFSKQCLTILKCSPLKLNLFITLVIYVITTIRSPSTVIPKLSKRYTNYFTCLLYSYHNQYYTYSSCRLLLNLYVYQFITPRLEKPSKIFNTKFTTYCKYHQPLLRYHSLS